MAKPKIKKTMSESDANAYKTQAEGKAALVTAWMPLMQLVTVVILALIAWKLGLLDSPAFKVIVDAISVFKP